MFWVLCLSFTLTCSSAPFSHLFYLPCCRLCYHTHAFSSTCLPCTATPAIATTTAHICPPAYVLPAAHTLDCHRCLHHCTRIAITYLHLIPVLPTLGSATVRYIGVVPFDFHHHRCSLDGFLVHLPPYAHTAVPQCTTATWFWLDCLLLPCLPPHHYHLLRQF